MLHDLFEREAEAIGNARDKPRTIPDLFHQFGFVTLHLLQITRIEDQMIHIQPAHSLSAPFGDLVGDFANLGHQTEKHISRILATRQPRTHRACLIFVRSHSYF